MSDFLSHFSEELPQPKKVDRTLMISGYVIAKRYRHWELIDPKGELVCLTVYKRGAKEVVRRLLGLDSLPLQNRRAIKEQGIASTK